MTAQGVGQLHFPSCLIPTLPPPIPVMGVVGHTIDSCITYHQQVDGRVWCPFIQLFVAVECGFIVIFLPPELQLLGGSTIKTTDASLF